MLDQPIDLFDEHMIVIRFVFGTEDRERRDIVDKWAIGMRPFYRLLRVAVSIEVGW